MTAYALYEPVNTLKPVADNVWIVDGPEIRDDLSLAAVLQACHFPRA